MSQSTTTTTTQKINQVMNTKQLLGYTIADKNDIKFDQETTKDIEKLYELSMKLKDKLNKIVPAQYQIKEESKQNENEQCIENLSESADNLKKNIHLFDPKLERVKQELQSQAQQQNLALLMNSLQSIGNFTGEDSSSLDNNSKSNDKNQLNSNTVQQCLQILESRWQSEMKSQKN